MAHLFIHNKKRQILMGAILDVTELLKEPSGIVGALVINKCAIFRGVRM